MKYSHFRTNLNQSAKQQGRFKLHLLAFSLLASLFIAGLLYIYLTYWSSLDWRYTHTEMTNKLPILDTSADDGLYQIAANGMRFRIRVAGLNNQGPNLVLLHGFPESSIVWTPLIDAASNAGYRVIAFDQRGYSPNARPSDIEAYSLALLESDLSNITSLLGFESFNLVGHDWGAVVAWSYAIHNPAKIESLTTLSIPHTGLFFDSVVNDPEQAKRTAYIDGLRRAWLPEYKMLKSELAFLKGWFSKLPNAHETEYLAILSEPGALTSALNWYRANPPLVLAADSSLQQAVQVPTLFIYGEDDAIAVPSVVARQADYIDADYELVSLKARHNLMQQKTTEVVAAIITHLDKYASTTSTN